MAAAAALQLLLVGKNKTKKPKTLSCLNNLRSVSVRTTLVCTLIQEIKTGSSSCWKIKIKQFRKMAPKSENLRSIRFRQAVKAARACPATEMSPGRGRTLNPPNPPRSLAVAFRRFYCEILKTAGSNATV